MAAVRKLRKLTPAERLVLGELAHWHSTKTGLTYRAQSDLAEDCELEPANVSRILSRLCRRGLLILVTKASQHKAARYHIPAADGIQPCSSDNPEACRSDNPEPESSLVDEASSLVVDPSQPCRSDNRSLSNDCLDLNSRREEPAPSAFLSLTRKPLTEKAQTAEKDDPSLSDDQGPPPSVPPSIDRDYRADTLEAMRESMRRIYDQPPPAPPAGRRRRSTLHAVVS